MRLERGTYYAGFSRPFFVPQGLIRSKLEDEGFTEIHFFQRGVGPTPPVDPRQSQNYSDDWDEWIRAFYPGPARDAELPATPAWMLRVPLQQKPAPGPTQPASLGCPGVDVDAWEKANRVKLFPGTWNHWLLARTKRDNPSGKDDIERTLRAVMGKWFSGTPLDPLLTFGGTTRSGAADLIELVAFGDTLSRPGEVQNMQRREDLPLSPPPTVEGAPVLVHARFAYRGAAPDLPWPVRKGGSVLSSTRCPVNADWILLKAWTEGEAPREMGTDEKAGAAVAETTNAAGRVVGLGLTLGALGVLAYLAFRRPS